MKRDHLATGYRDVLMISLPVMNLSTKHLTVTLSGRKEDTMTIEALEKAIEGRNYFCGHARLLQVNLNCTLDDKTNFSFSFKLCLPTNVKKNKIIILINFTPNVPDKYCPAEEIIDMGWSFAALDYQSITSDTNTPDGLAEIYAPNGETGKISLWAWAAMRIMDYLQTRDDIDLANIGVVGHSRLGKTALWTAANDERFRFVHLFASPLLFILFTISSSFAFIS